MSKSFFTIAMNHLESLPSATQMGVEAWAKGDATVAEPVFSQVMAEMGSESVYGRDDVSQAFKLAGAFGLGEHAGIEQFAGTTPQVAPGSTIVQAADLGFKDLRLGTEAITPRNMENVKLFTIGLNLMVAKNNNGVSAFMPTIMLDCGQLAIEATVTSEVIVNSPVYDNVTNASKIKKSPLITSMRDLDTLAAYSTRVMPVVSEDTNPVLLTAATETSTVTAEAFDTAPILFGKDVNLLEITQTPAAIAGGYNDSFSAIDTAVYTEAITLGLADDSELFKVNVRDVAYANWVYSQQDDGRDLSLQTDLFMIVDNTTKQIDGTSAVTALSSVAVGSKVILKLPVAGTGNTESGVFKVMAGDLTVASYTDINGEAITGTPLTDLQTALANTVARGYDLEVRLASDDMRASGIVSTVEDKTTLYYLPQHSPIVKYKPAFKNATCSTDSLEAAVTTEVVTYKALVLREVFRTIERFSGQLRNIIATGKAAADVQTFGIGRRHFTPTLVERTFDGAEDVRSISSGNGDIDVAGALAMRIKSVVAEMDATSGYSHVKDSYEPSYKKVIHLWCNSSVAIYLGNLKELMGLGDEYDVVVSTHAIADKQDIYVMFGTNNGNTTSELNMFQFGNVVVAPSLVYDGAISKSGAVVNGTYLVPRFLPIINHPILGVVTVSNLGAATKCCGA